MRAGWIFCPNDGDNNPDLPAGVGGSLVNPLDIVRLTGGPAGNEHDHLLVGGIAINSDQVGIFHEHIVGHFGTQWIQITRPDSVAAHTHDLPTDANGNLQPQWFLAFWKGSDADAAMIASSETCYVACEATITEQDGQIVIGDLDNTPWDAGELTTWRTRMLNVLGIDLPDQVDRGSRLVALFVGSLLSRGGQPERALRFTS